MEIEGVSRGVLGAPLDFLLLLFSRQTPQVDALEVQRQVRRNHLHGLAVDLGEAGSQRLVTGDERLETLLQCVGVERPVHPEERRVVVRGARRGKLLKEPEPLLGEGERHDGATGRGSDGGGGLLAP